MAGPVEWSMHPSLVALHANRREGVAGGACIARGDASDSVSYLPVGRCGDGICAVFCGPRGCPRRGCSPFVAGGRGRPAARATGDGELVGPLPSVQQATGKVVARRFHKFFNVGELEETKAEKIDLSRPYVVLTKYDGYEFGFSTLSKILTLFLASW